MRLHTKYLSALLILMTAAASVFAADRIPVNEDLGAASSWQKDYELTEDMKGKYNVVVTATDSAGNVTKTDAFNIYIDLESDMPKVGITNPSVDMIVQGNLNIVGTATDDDDVAKVNLIFDGDKENIVTAKGTRFWSYTLPTKDLEEGHHTLEVYATDINGLDGHSTTVEWILNRRVPSIEVTSHNMGQIVHDKVELEGTVSDGNGIVSLEYSLDEGKTYKAASISRNKVESKFKISLDSKKMTDGATFCYLKAKDATGSEAQQVFFFYIDNSNPEVRILTPDVTESRNGHFTVAGYAKDAVGLKSLKWAFASQSGEIELIPGSNYWAVEVDGAGLNGKQNFEITATDSVNNVVTVKQPILVDSNADIPVTTITHFGKDYLQGYVSDDDGVASVSYVFDKDGEVTFDSNGAFSIKFDKELEYGKHSITVYGTDIYGTKGKVASASFSYDKPKEVKKPAPVPNEDGTIPEPEPENQPPSIDLAGPVAGSWVTRSLNIRGTVSDDVKVATVEYCLDPAGTTWIPARIDGSGSFSVNVDISDSTAYPDGYIPVTVRVTDNNEELPLTTYAYSAVKKDNTAPVVKRIAPEPGVPVNGKFLILFDVDEANQITSIQYNNGKAVELSEGLRVLENPYLLVGTDDFPYSSSMKFTFTDINGNKTDFTSWSNINYDSKSDRPVVSFNVPQDNEVVTTDFKVSGIATDDDGNCLIYYSIDGGKYQLYSSEYVSSYSFDVPVASLGDNGHTISVYAVDLNGLKGDEVTRRVRVSLEEPTGAMTEPDLSISVRNDVTISGTANDANGISLVQVSLDNGITYNNATGTKNWTYKFNSKVIEDGTHAVFIKIFDGYGIQSMFSSMITIDNNVPTITLDYPKDGTTLTNKLGVVGRINDTIGLSQAYINMRSFTDAPIPGALKRISLSPDATIVSQDLDITALADGDYNIELVCVDRAGNVTKLSRNFTVNKKAVTSRVSVLYPMPDSYLNRKFNIYGTAIYMDEVVAGVDLYIDGKLCQTVERAVPITDGFYKFTIDGSEAGLTEGTHTFRVVETSESGGTVSSAEQSFIYSSSGAWVTMDNFVYGDFATERPMLKGVAGFALTDEQLLDKKMKAGKKVKEVQLSLDNGKTFVKVGSGSSGKWQYRVENLDIPAGEHFVLVKAVMTDNTEAITRLMFQVDRNSPDVEVITPVEGNHYNQTIGYSGIAGDDVALENVTIQLRRGDKNSYQLPSFIQGLYIDTNVWGASLYSVGLGLTAFDGAVKIQGQFGQFSKEQWNWVYTVLGQQSSPFRFGGNIFGGKIIAQLADIPFMYFWGRDFEWLHATAAIGANFSYFTESGSGSGQMLSAILGQVEFPKAIFSKNKCFKTWAVYYEPQVWFISSDLATDLSKTFVPTFSIGLRTSVF